MMCVVFFKKRRAHGLCWGFLGSERCIKDTCVCIFLCVCVCGVCGVCYVCGVCNV